MQKEDSRTISMEMLLKKYKDRKIAKNEVSFFYWNNIIRLTVINLSKI